MQRFQRMISILMAFLIVAPGCAATAPTTVAPAVEEAEDRLPRGVSLWNEFLREKREPTLNYSGKRWIATYPSAEWASNIAINELLLAADPNTGHGVGVLVVTGRAGQDITLSPRCVADGGRLEPGARIRPPKNDEVLGRCLAPIVDVGNQASRTPYVILGIGDGVEVKPNQQFSLPHDRLWRMRGTSLRASHEMTCVVSDDPERLTPTSADCIIVSPEPPETLDYLRGMHAVYEDPSAADPLHGPVHTQFDVTMRAIFEVEDRYVNAPSASLLAEIRAGLNEHPRESYGSFLIAIQREFVEAILAPMIEGEKGSHGTTPNLGLGLGLSVPLSPSRELAGAGGNPMPAPGTGTTSAPGPKSGGQLTEGTKGPHAMTPPLSHESGGAQLTEGTKGPHAMTPPLSHGTGGKPAQDRTGATPAGPGVRVQHGPVSEGPAPFENRNPPPPRRDAQARSRLIGVGVASGLTAVGIVVGASTLSLTRPGGKLHQEIESAAYDTPNADLYRFSGDLCATALSLDDDDVVSLCNRHRATTGIGIAALLGASISAASAIVLGVISRQEARKQSVGMAPMGRGGIVVFSQNF